MSSLLLFLMFLFLLFVTASTAEVAHGDGWCALGGGVRSCRAPFSMYSPKLNSRRCASSVTNEKEKKVNEGDAEILNMQFISPGEFYAQNLT